ncbi:MAG: DedA family protein [Streptosporangiales bacterium]|nr:DedA family protein [Streptosporangiales bacterium]
MLEYINELIGSIMGSPSAYPAIFLVCAIDAFFPAVPSETVVIAAAAVRAAGDPGLLWVIVLAAIGAFVGDHVSYAIGRFFGSRAVRRLLGGRRGRAAQEWAERMLLERGGLIIVALRFIPGGRTATTLAAGTLRYPLRRFTAFDAVAALCWAMYATGIGYFAGGLFKGNHLLAVVVGIGVSVAMSAVVETVRHLLRRRRTTDRDVMSSPSA